MVKARKIIGQVGYNSHGNWSTLEEIRSTELERGNTFPVVKLPANTPVIWVCKTRMAAARYAAPASIAVDSKALHFYMKNISEIPISERSVVLAEDGDGGYLITGERHRNKSRYYTTCPQGHRFLVATAVSRWNGKFFEILCPKCGIVLPNAGLAIRSRGSML